MTHNLINQPWSTLKTMTCKRCGDSEDRIQGYCSNQCKDLKEVEELRFDLQAAKTELERQKVICDELFNILQLLESGKG